MKSVDYERDSDDDIWNDIQTLFADDLLFDVPMVISYSHILEFGVPIASGLRFRYSSEIEKKSYSAIKGDRNQAPTIKVLPSSDTMLHLELVTEMSSSDNTFPHFYTLYEVAKMPIKAEFIEGMCFIPLKQNCPLELRLDSLGIRKWKLKEAIPSIRQKYPQFNEIQAKDFFNKNKETVKLRASLVQEKYAVSTILSNTIKSQISKENKAIKIQHLSPKRVADCTESLIIVLEKKITSKSTAYLIFDGGQKILLQAYHDDGQTLVLNLPRYTALSPITGKVRIECSDYFDEKPIRFEPSSQEMRKRKNAHYESDLPLKNPKQDESPRQLFPESGSYGTGIEFDGPLSMEIGDNEDTEPFEGHISGNESCKDSGIYSGDKSSTSDRSDDDESLDDSDDESDTIEIEGVRRRRINPVMNLEPINFPSPKREISSNLITDKKDQVTNKILSEVARIGHDFAFGKQPEDLLKRIEKQLPVVYTLQDDVGDTPLNNAILKGNMIPAERILTVVRDECSWALDLPNSSGHTALILAPACDVPDTFIKKLLEAGCKLDAQDDLGKSAITYAIEYKNTPALRVLLQHSQKLNMRHVLQRYEKNYFTHLQIAVMNGFVEGVDLLLNLKDNNGDFMVDVNELALMNDDTALHIAVERNVELDIIRLLLARPDIDINHKKNKTSTVLNTAIKMELVDVVQLLESNSAENIYDRADPEEAQESDDDEMEDDGETISPSVPSDMCTVVEMTPEYEDSSSNVVNLTETMENLSLKGENRTRLIDIFLHGHPILTVNELQKIIKPSFRTLINKDQDRREITDILVRFNCLPNSFGELFERLREINRLDIIQKVASKFNS